MSALDIYLMTRLDEVKALLTILTVAGAIGMTAMVLMLIAASVEGMDMDGARDIARRWLPRAAGLTVIVATLTVLTPSTKEMAAIVAVPKIVNSPAAQELGEKTIEAAKAWLEEIVSKKRGRTK